MRITHLFPPFVLLLLLINACTYDQVVAIERCDLPLELELLESASSSCGLATGSILARAAGGSVSAGEVSFSLNGTDFQSSPEFGSLAAGAYTLHARQGACATELDFSIGNTAGLNAEVMVIPSGCTVPSGSIEVMTTDAFGAVRFTINGGQEQSTNTFTDLSPGEYEIKARDESGCEVTLSAKVVSDVVFAQVETIVTASCAVSGCHAGNVSPDFRVRENILARAERIRARTGNKSMPPSSSGRSLNDAQINAIACWVADGAPE